MSVNHTLPQSMRAIRIHEYGDASVLRLDEVPLPRMKSDDVLVKVHSSSVNPVDWKIREGYLREVLSNDLPLILGWDVAGEIVALGDKVKGWQLGDAVYSRPNIERNGSYAEYIAINYLEIATKPRTLSYQQAAVIPLTALTAWQAMFDVASLCRGEKVLIHGAAGGVGVFATQLAKFKGAEVYTTSSTRNLDFVRSLGADHVIDYTTDDFTQLKDIDVVFDTLGGPVQKNSWGVLKQGGRMVSIVSPPDASDAAKIKGKALFCFVQPNGGQLEKIAKIIDEGKMHVFIDSVYPLTQISAAHVRSQTGHVRGKISLQIV